MHVTSDLDVSSPRLQTMMSCFAIIAAITSVFSRMSDRESAMDQLEELWDELRAYDKEDVPQGSLRSCRPL